MPGQVVVTIRDKQWSCLVANTYAELTSGLSGVSSLPPQTGVFFDLGYDQQYIQINMSQMLFPLDIIFINSTQGVVGVLRNVQPGEEASLSNQNLPGARCFLEVNAGEAEGIEVGDNVDIQGYVQPAASPIDLMLGVMPYLMFLFMMMKMMDKALEEPKPKKLGSSATAVLPQTMPKGLTERIQNLWRKACEWEHIPPESKSVVFSEDNPFVKDYNAAVGQLFRFRQYRAGEWQLATTFKKSKGDPRRDTVMREIARWYGEHRRHLEPGESMPIIRKHYKLKKDVDELVNYLRTPEGIEHFKRELRMEAVRRGLVKLDYQPSIIVRDLMAESVMSMADKVKELGFNPEDMLREIMKVDDVMLYPLPLVLLPEHRRKPILEGQVYPLLRAWKAKYGFDLHLDVGGVDIIRLESNLDSLLVGKRYGTGKAPAVIPLTPVTPLARKHKPYRSDVSVHSWVERDRLGIWVTDKGIGDQTLIEWWDEDAAQMFGDGWFKPGTIKGQEITGRDFEESVLDYLEYIGVLEKSKQSFLPQTIERGEVIEIPFKEAPEWLQSTWKSLYPGSVPRVRVYRTTVARIHPPFFEYAVRDIVAYKAGKTMSRYVPSYESQLSSSPEEKALYFGGAVTLRPDEMIAVMDYWGDRYKHIDLYAHPAAYEPPKLVAPSLTERQMKILATIRGYISTYRKEVFQRHKVTQSELDELQRMGLIDKRGAITVLGRNVAGKTEPLKPSYLLSVEPVRDEEKPKVIPVEKPERKPPGELEYLADSPELLPVARLLEKWSKARNSALALKDLEALGPDYDIEECRQALVDYRDIRREDYSDPEEYQEEKDAAWEQFLECLETLAGEEEEMRGYPMTTPEFQAETATMLDGLRITRAYKDVSMYSPNEICVYLHAWGVFPKGRKPHVLSFSPSGDKYWIQPLYGHVEHELYVPVAKVKSWIRTLPVVNSKIMPVSSEYWAAAKTLGEEVDSMIEILPLKKGKAATVPLKPHLRKETDLEYLADSPEFLAQTIEAIGYRDKLDTAFQEAIARTKELK